MDNNRKLMVARLAAAYRQGRLVPFLGAGMSVPACPNWENFIIGLERQAFGRKQPDKPGLSRSEEQIRRANAAVRHFRLRGESVLYKAVQNALNLKASEKTPEQTLALAKIYWPLTLTSNYEDLFYRAWNRKHAVTSNTLRVLGRSPADCRQVLASLHFSRPPTLWALQGYVGSLPGPGLRELRRAWTIHRLGEKNVWARLEDAIEKSKKLGEDIKKAAIMKRKELRQQLVVGHEEYRRVAFTEPQFRRAFAEVFRSRSFLFVGSGLADQYLLNLFGEAMEIFGSSPFPHYALVNKGETDPDFLRSRLNTFVYEYNGHPELPDILNELHQTLENRSALIRTWSYSVPASVRSRKKRMASDIHIVRGDLPQPLAQECLAVGVRITDRHRVSLNKNEQRLFRRMGCLPQVRKLKFPDNALSMRIAGQPLYLYAISSSRGQPDLRWFSRAITDLLSRVDPGEFTLIRTKLPFPEHRDSSSILGKVLKRLLPYEKFPLRFWLMEILRAYGRWRRGKGDGGGLELAVHLSDPGVLFDMTTGRIDPLELLMCDDLRFTVEVEHNTQTLVSESYQCQGDVVLRKLAEAMHILPATDTRQSPGQWLVEVDPSPTGLPHIRSLAASASRDESLNTTLSEFGVVTDCVLRFVWIPQPESEATPRRMKRKIRSTAKKAAAKKSSAARKKAGIRKKAAVKKKASVKRKSTKKRPTTTKKKS